MAAKDYVFQTGWLNVFLAKKIKSNRLMSQDRRIVTDGEIIGLFEWYLRKRCKEVEDNTIVITNSDGKKLFEATLIEENKDV